MKSRRNEKSGREQELRRMGRAIPAARAQAKADMAREETIIDGGEAEGIGGSSSFAVAAPRVSRDGATSGSSRAGGGIAVITAIFYWSTTGYWNATAPL